MKTQTKDIQDKLTPKNAHQILVEGNNRFVQNKRAHRDLKTQVIETSQGQYPFAVILSCIDSRVPAEIIFDLGIGDIFSARVAGNVVNEDMLGSMEYGCKIAGSKIIVVMGHSKCGAVTSACKGVELGNITALLSKISPAINHTKNENGEVTTEFIESVSKENVFQSIEQIRSRSIILKEMEDKGEIEIVGAMYSVETGKVDFI